jgi:hypothetical protein
MASEPNKHKTTSLDELYDYLKRFSLSDSLFVISIVNNAFKYGINALSDDANKNTVAWITDHCKTDIDKFALMAHMTRMARFLLLSRANDYKTPILDTGTQEMSYAIHLVATLYEIEVEGTPKSLEDLTINFGRLGQWQFPLQARRDAIMGRGYLLFEEIPKALGIRYNFDAKMKEYFGLDVLQFIASGLAAWTMSTGVLKYKLTIDVPDLAKIVSTATLDKFVELSSGTPEDYRRYIRGENWKSSDKLLDIYFLDPLLKMPAVRVERSGKLEPGQYVVPQPLYLLMRASLGVFHLLADKEREIATSQGKSGKNDFKEVFGEVYREYVGRQLFQATQPVGFIDIDKEIETDIRKPDFALIKDDTCILFEVKTSFLTLEPRMLFDKALAKQEIDLPKGNFKKAVDQLNSFEEGIKTGKINDTRFKGITKIVKIIVGFEDLFLSNAFLLPIAKETYGQQMERFQIATLSDIELLGAKLANRGDVLKVVWEKASSAELSQWSLSAFVFQSTKETSAENPLLKKTFRNFFLKITGRDYDLDDDSLI